MASLNFGEVVWESNSFVVDFLYNIALALMNLSSSDLKFGSFIYRTRMLVKDSCWKVCDHDQADAMAYKLALRIS
jgi:hypothetical protein